MGDRLQAGKPSQYVTSHQVNSAFHPSRVGKSSTGLAGVKVGCVHLCRVEGNTVCDPIWQVTLRSCEVVFHEQLYQLYLYLYLYLHLLRVP